MSNYYRRKRTIAMPETRAQQIALAAASVDMTSEEFIQNCITAGLLAMAEHDTPLAFALARACGATWDQLTELAKSRR